MIVSELISADILEIQTVNRPISLEGDNNRLGRGLKLSQPSTVRTVAIPESSENIKVSSDVFGNQPTVTIAKVDPKKPIQVATPGNSK